MRRITSVAFATIVFFLNLSALALDKVEGKTFAADTYINSPWPYTVLSNSCKNPQYHTAGLLQGIWYDAGWYCANLSILRIKPYQP